MQMQGNTIFITGGTSGIGRGLAEAFFQRGNQVIITGRREERLKAICARHPGMYSYVLDVTNPAAIQAVARRAIDEFPSINCVINNAGVQMRLNFVPGTEFDPAGMETQISTNLLGPMRVAMAFLPHLAGQSGATLVNVSSGLAFVPSARFPVYCATKAAIHAWTLSLRHQLRRSGIKVIELIPPYVATELGGPGKPAVPAGGRGPMALDAFIAETMRELEPDVEEVAVGSAKRLVAAAALDEVKKAFVAMNG
jgi:uncharacterized oxidoreductase